MYKTQEVKDLLYMQTRWVKFKSMDKVHQNLVTIPKDFKSNSDKIIVWECENKHWMDIEIENIISINEHYEHIQ
tara:strand:+ start:328 stop:549 length:222 start_codon:yes stop_codon:yes gene_type:complete